MTRPEVAVQRVPRVLSAAHARPAMHRALDRHICRRFDTEAVGAHPSGSQVPPTSFALSGPRRFRRGTAVAHAIIDARGTGGHTG